MHNNSEIVEQILQGSLIPTFVINTHHKITHWNRACEKLTGLSAEEVIGTRKQGLAYYRKEKPVLADCLVDGMSKDEIIRRYGSVLQESFLVDGALEAEGFFPDLGEEGTWLFFTAAPLKDVGGKIIGAIETLQDITDRKRSAESILQTQVELERQVKERTAELARINATLEKEIAQRKEAEIALRQSEEKFRTISDFAYNWEYWVKQDGTFAYVSPSFEEISGYSVKEFMEKPDLIFTICHPDDQVQLIEHIKEEPQSVQTHHMDFRIITKAGDIRWIAHSCRPVYDTGGKHLGRRASNRNVTKRVQAEQALQRERKELELRVQERTTELSSAYLRLQKEVEKRDRAYAALQFTRFSIEHSDDLLYWSDSVGKIIDVNETTCSKLGYSKNEILAMNIMDIFLDLTFEEYQKSWQQLKNEGALRVETNHRSKHGDIIPVEIHLNYIEFDGMGYNCAFARDISQRKELERLVSIEDKMSSLGRVAAGIAHEIRNPLSTINVYLSTLKNMISTDNQGSAGSGDIEEVVAEMDTASRKIEAVVKRVMDFSNPSQQEKQEMDVNRCVSDAVDLSQVTLRKSGISLDLKLEETLPDCYINRLSIEQVILNLITNATEELQESQGKRQVEIRTYQIVNGNGVHCIAITVSDSGQGVPRKLRDRIFDPFFTTKHHGSGIGLSICQRIITDHSGVLYVEENRWSGAKFVVEIPVANEVER